MGKTKEEIKQELDRELIVRLFVEKLNDHNKSWDGCANSIIRESKDLTPEEFFCNSKRGDIILDFFYLERDTKGFPKLEKLKLVEIKCLELIMPLTTHPSAKNGIKVAKKYALGKATEEELEEAHTWTWQVYKEMRCGGRNEYNHTSYDYSIINAIYTITDISNYQYDNNIIDKVVTVAKESPFMSTRKVMEKCADICRELLWIPKTYLK